ncbi:hypothetical protein HN924_00105 [Candidatus Woesearchaeota archaeon]|jgi:hypothetical protein|nr:hypothetical protein [Candidatus Woesearchaeota archaeon]MBT7062353.1 hypothetical protein [Candidatus Woesearchaeota archaeon]MBT7402828.1 hypothetical protein [Candidatus Woesearchaeota archaeon]
MTKKPQRLNFQIEFPYDLELFKECAEGYANEDKRTALFTKSLHSYLSKSDTLAIAPWKIKNDIRDKQGDSTNSLVLHRWSWAIGMGRSPKAATAQLGPNMGIECCMFKDLVQEAYPDKDFNNIAIEPAGSHIQQNSYLVFLSYKKTELIDYIRENSELINHI